MVIGAGIQQVQQKKQSPLVAIVLILIIAVCVGFVVKALMPKKYTRPMVNYVCENCDARFKAEYQTPPIKCIKCGEKKAVQVIKYQCEKCKHIFEQKIRNMDDQVQMLIPECPKCGSDMLMPAPTEAKE